MSYASLLRSILMAETLLIIPLLSNMYAAEYLWEAGDYIAAAILLAFLGLFVHGLVIGIRKNNHLIWVGVIGVLAVILAWAELAVGIFD